MLQKTIIIENIRRSVARGSSSKTSGQQRILTVPTKTTKSWSPALLAAINLPRLGVRLYSNLRLVSPCFDRC